jgi:hypothetical protein
LVPGLVYGRQYYFAVQAYNNAGLSSSPSAEVAGVAAVDSTPAAANLLMGLGQTVAPNGGWFAIHGGAEYNFGPNAFGRLPWPTYNATGGGLRLASGDVDGDGLDEVVVGLGRGSNGWVAVLDDAAHGYALLRWIQVLWPQYNAANGEVFPAVGNIDGDSRAEIVLGLGDGGKGWYQILDDAGQGYRHLSWKQVPWAVYTAGQGPTHPAIGDVTGDGVGEIVIGLGRGSAGWLEVVNGAALGFSHRSWIQINRPTYNVLNGTTYPAVGDLDNNGLGEIVVGLGAGSGGYFAILDDATAGFAHLSWQQTSWTLYNAANGETHPAVGNVDGDARKEIVLGLGQYIPGNGGWFEIREDASGSYASRGWRNVGFPAFTASGGALFPAVSKR